MHAKSIGTNKSKTYKICTFCIMDTSDPDIVFNDEGRCNHCLTSIDDEGSDPEFLIAKSNFLKSMRLQIVDEIKKDGQKKPYDCIIGVSGGVDSSYVAWLVKDLGLRPLAIHLDNGWNTELAVQNIKKLLQKLNIDLHTHLLDWEEFRDLQLAFLKSSTPDSEIPTDHAIFALHYDMAEKYDLKYFISGGNRQTESIMPAMWSQGHCDWTYIKTIHRLFGSGKLKTFPHLTWSKRNRCIFNRGIQWVNILDFIEYRKKDAMAFLQEKLDWKPYPQKHGESVYTRFFQEYILPIKFNADKRRAHLSSLIANRELTRKEAIDRMDQEKPSKQSLKEDKAFVVKKLGLSEEEFDHIMSLPRKSIHDYHNSSFNPLYLNATKALIKFQNPRIWPFK